LVPDPAPGRRRAPTGLATRRAALDILTRVERDRAFADVLLGHRLAAFAKPADRRLVTELVLGVSAWRGRLDYELAQLSRLPLAQLDPIVLNVLRIGLYQLRRLTRTPPHAIIDTAVSLAREHRRETHIGGFVNAVLRAAQRTAVALPDRRRDELDYLAIAYSHPRWLAEKLVEWFGTAEAEALMAAHNEPAPNVLRLNLARGTPATLLASIEREGMTIARRGLLPETVYLKGAAIFASSAYGDGLFLPQSEASQMVTRLLDPSPGATVIDLAAAPGGKTTHLAELVGRDGRVIACDASFVGLKRIRELARRLHHPQVLVVRCDSARGVPLPSASAAAVLLDAPCTGLGTLREHPELRWRLQPDDFARMAKLQLPMLHQAAATVKPGGVLVYSVCSLAPEEGEKVVAEFLRTNPQFVVQPPTTGPLAPLINRDGFLRTRPDREARDGFFAARLARRQL